ncbi:hypothetical protein WJX79_004252 [Trebouxia sp. C0005]
MFTDADQFRAFIRHECLGEELQKLLPTPDDVKSNAAFKAMQKRMRRQLPQAGFGIHCLSQLRTSCSHSGKLDLVALLTAAVQKEHKVLIQIVDRCMVRESDVYVSEGQRLSDEALCEDVLDKVLLHHSCLVRKLCQPSAYGCNTDTERDVCFMVDSSGDTVRLTDFSTSLADWQENCQAGQPGAKPKGACVEKNDPVLEALYSMYSPDDIASQLQYHTKGAAAVEAAYQRLSDEAAQHAERTAQKAFDDLLQDEASMSAKAAAKAAAKQAKKLRQKAKRTPVIAQQATHPLESAQLVSNVALQVDAAEGAAAPIAAPTTAPTTAPTAAPTVAEPIAAPASVQDAPAQAKQGTAALPKCTQPSIKNAADTTVTVSTCKSDQTPVPCTDSMRTCCSQPARVPCVHQPVWMSTSSGVTPLPEQTCSLCLDGKRRAAAKAPAENKLFCCPITKVLLVEPVIAADGHTYEKSAMEHWLEQHVTSPVTGTKLMHARLVPNRVFRSIIANSVHRLRNRNALSML